jgi:hypothetical protein
MEIVEGRTRLEARTGNKVEFHVNCARLDLQSPRGQIQAHGDVKLTGSGLEGTCDRLSISWQDENVALEGQVRLTCHRDGQNVELAADRLTLKLSTAAPAKAADVGLPVPPNVILPAQATEVSGTIPAPPTRGDVRPETGIPAKPPEGSLLPNPNPVDVGSGSPRS